MSSWLLLLFAGLLETAWALGLKSTDGFRAPLPTALVVLAMAASMWLLALASRDLPIGTAYAAWVGIGVLGAVFGGAVFFGEALTPARLGCVALLLVALVGLKVTG